MGTVDGSVERREGSSDEVQMTKTGAFSPFSASRMLPERPKDESGAVERRQKQLETRRDTRTEDRKSRGSLDPDAPARACEAKLMPIRAVNRRPKRAARAGRAEELAWEGREKAIARLGRAMLGTLVALARGYAGYCRRREKKSSRRAERSEVESRR
jgi:hypothetical protein